MKRDLARAGALAMALAAAAQGEAVAQAVMDRPNRGLQPGQSPPVAAPPPSRPAPPPPPPPPVQRPAPSPPPAARPQYVPPPPPPPQPTQVQQPQPRPFQAAPQGPRPFQPPQQIQVNRPAYAPPPAPPATAPQDAGARPPAIRQRPPGYFQETRPGLQFYRPPSAGAVPQVPQRAGPVADPSRLQGPPRPHQGQPARPFAAPGYAATPPGHAGTQPGHAATGPGYAATAPGHAMPGPAPVTGERPGLGPRPGRDRPQWGAIGQGNQGPPAQWHGPGPGFNQPSSTATPPGNGLNPIPQKGYGAAGVAGAGTAGVIAGAGIGAVIANGWQPAPSGNIDGVRGERRSRYERERDRLVMEEPGRRYIVRENGRNHIHYDPTFRLRLLYGGRFGNGGRNVWLCDRPDGAVVTTYLDDDGRLLRLTRQFPGYGVTTLIDNGPAPSYGFLGEPAISVPPPQVDVPLSDYVVDAASSGYGDFARAFQSPPVDHVDRAYTLDEIRASPELRDRMRRVDVDTLGFAPNSWTLEPSQGGALAEVARAMLASLALNPEEIFLVEGHTDAVGGDLDNLSLSDRRAEAVADLLSRNYGVPAENMVTQGYGERYPKVDVQGPEPRNRRVTVRRITPLLKGPGVG